MLVPGAGLGRLAWEIARLGYICQGNEWSFFMLFSSNFVLNRYSTHRHEHSCGSVCLTQCPGTTAFLCIHACRISLPALGGTVPLITFNPISVSAIVYEIRTHCSVVWQKNSDLWTSAPFRCEQVNSLTVYPWIHQFSNNKKSSDQTRPIRFPDVNPQSLPLNADFSMVAGDFVEVYSDSGQ